MNDFELERGHVDIDDIGNHPDLRDEKWLREAERRARKEARKELRRTSARRTSSGLRRSGRTALVVLTVVAVAAGLASAWRAGWFERDTPTAAPASTATAPGTVLRVDPERPFEGTPAATWADGAAGIVVPEAQPLGEYSAEQVADAYQRVRAAIVAARLDRELVEGHDATAFIGLFADEHQEWLRERFDGAHDQEASAYATRVAKEQHLLPVEPKVNGTMRAEVAESGELVVRTNHVFAYAFATALPVVDPMEVVAALRTEAEYAFFSGRRYRPASQGMWLRGAKGFRHSIGCEATKAGFLAPSISEVSRSTRRSEHENEYYFDHTQPMATDGTCPD